MNAEQRQLLRICIFDCSFRFRGRMPDHLCQANNILVINPDGMEMLDDIPYWVDGDEFKEEIENIAQLCKKNRVVVFGCLFIKLGVQTNGGIEVIDTGKVHIRQGIPVTHRCNIVVRKTQKNNNRKAPARQTRPNRVARIMIGPPNMA